MTTFDQWRPQHMPGGTPTPTHFWPGWYAVRCPRPEPPDQDGNKYGTVLEISGPFPGEAECQQWCQERNVTPEVSP